MRGAVWLAIAGLLMPGVAAAQYAVGEPPSARPTFRTLRFDEDWSVLAHPESLPSRDFFDPIKYVPLTPNGELWAGFGADARARGELWSDYQFGAPRGADHDDRFLLTRWRTYGDLHWRDRAHVFVELKSSLATDIDLPGGRSAAYVDTFAVQNGFVEVVPWQRGNERLRLRVGREELLFGAQRLVGPSDWSNVRRTFDGATATLELERVRATAFFTRPVRVRTHDWNDHIGGDRFYGIYGSAAKPLPGGLGMDLYWLAVDRGNRTVNGTSGDEHRHTIGTRLHGSIGDSGFDAELETAFQVGSLGGRSLRAGMVSAELGYWRTEWWGAPRFHLGADWASGDRRAGGSVETFDPLYPTGHRWFGEIDAIGRSNLVAIESGVVLRPLPATTARVTVYRFWRASRDDALYAASGAVLRPGNASRDRPTGTEVDVVLGYRIDPHAQIGAGWGHFFTDSFIQSSGPGRDVDFVYLFFEYEI